MEQLSFEFVTPPREPAPRVDSSRPTFAEVVDDYILKTLEYCDGKAARILGINRRTIMRRRKGKG